MLLYGLKTDQEYHKWAILNPGWDAELQHFLDSPAAGGELFVVADHHELNFIKANFFGIRFANGKSIVWTGADASFILSNLLEAKRSAR